MAATTYTYTGTGQVSSGDFKAVKWTGKTKAGEAVEINFTKAINLGNVDLAFAEKDDTVAEVVFTAVYTNTDTMSVDGTAVAEPWSLKWAAGATPTASGEILLGAGIFSIGGTDVALTRGGGSFTVERTFREINADGDRGPVEGRIVMDGSRATLTLRTLQILSRVSDLYAAINVATS